MGRKYAQEHLVGGSKLKVGRAKGSAVRVHYKNTRETAAVLQGLSLAKAYTYIDDVLEHKQCVPFRRHNGGVGRTAQAKQFGATQGRWPVKSARYIKALLKNAESNAAVNELEVEDLYIRSIQVQEAPKTRRRTFRAHGRINPYQGHPCHMFVPFFLFLPSPRRLILTFVTVKSCWQRRRRPSNEKRVPSLLHHPRRPPGAASLPPRCPTWIFLPCAQPAALYYPHLNERGLQHAYFCICAPMLPMARSCMSYANQQRRLSSELQRIAASVSCIVSSSPSGWDGLKQAN
ncbi:uncharacterized protein L969DRAFT_95826 [Mixia osmundae IAM 14324]|uniref:Ribosomal protein L22 n=1 Tax=Mixia osmundae (strain CBS 9802 / IAM 14324 / JCM 22182 / KY 12970) TaxID=764103 RepID=G7DSG3_MIXOS|nr:uncharacterized protein L969DRAFT_95826 [Mixia osmundae IAM 14324]KEI37982.1 hypothetical protein L969DRAFT_95826 [Mixia osmundae IAM 14324]GAA93523.1 hypothetical protein E5Q_00164 [Mixia osmundae IAM 14324]